MEELGQQLDSRLKMMDEQIQAIKEIANLRRLDNHIENLKDKLKQCYTSNPLQFWDKNQITAKLEMKDKDKEIRVKPMRYNPEDQKEFRF